MALITNSYFSQFWRLEVPDQGTSIFSEGPLSGLKTIIFSLCLLTEQARELPGVSFRRTLILCISAGKEYTCNAGDPGSIPGLGKSSGEGNGYSFQYLCLENSMDREAWWATVHGSQTVGHDWATNTHTHAHTLLKILRYSYKLILEVRSWDQQYVRECVCVCVCVWWVC